jgi:hypothetical protein
MMTHDEMIAVIAHHKDGGEVEVRNKCQNYWEATISPCWDFESFDYRPKPKPMSLWVGIMPDGQTINYGRIKPEKIHSSATLKQFIEVTKKTTRKKTKK